MTKSSWSRVKAAALVATVAATVLVPLYGDPRRSPVTHAEWGRMLLRALELDQTLPDGAQASTVFATLSWRNSLAYRADRYQRADGVTVALEGRTARVLAVAAAGEVAYPLAVVRGGDYRVRLRMQGDPKSPAAAEIRRIGEVAPEATFRVSPASVSGWIDGGEAHLDPGAYEATVLLPGGASLEAIEVAPPCLSAVEPPGGWQATAVAQNTDVAVTTLKALDLEWELPPAATPIEVTGVEFQATTAAVSPAAATSYDGLWLRGGRAGLQALVMIDLPEAGLYTVSVFGSHAGAQSWLADSCRKAVLCDERAEGTEPEAGGRWRVLMTTDFTAGRHVFTVNLAPGAAVERLRLERKKDGPLDYEAALRRVGFDVGPAGPIARDRAIEAVGFIQGRRRAVLAGPCGDVEPPGAVLADRGLAQPVAAIPGPGLPPLSSGTGPAPLAPPVIPPQQPASPVTP